MKNEKNGGPVPRSAGARGREGGFTLIEVLVALVVTVSALAIISQGLTTGGRASVISQNTTKAAMLAQRIMTAIETGELSIDGGDSKAFDDEPDFAYETLSVPDPDEPGLVDLTVTIKWKEREEDRRYDLMRLMRDKTATATTP
jgi:prepilin-type N-terminal cleavage/methylation domain-containing protein